jgi:hypothetical protein
MMVGDGSMPKYAVARQTEWAPARRAGAALTRRSPVALARRGALLAVAAVTAGAALAAPADARSTRAPAPVIDPTSVAGAPCNVISPSYCMLVWADADGVFSATGVHAEGSRLVLDGVFTGRRSTAWPWLISQYVSVTRQRATVPVGSVTISRRTVTFHALRVPSDCGLTGVSCTIDTNPVRMTDTSNGDSVVLDYSEEPFVVTAHPTHDGAKHLSRDWRRARTTAARAAVLRQLLFGRH